MTHFDAEPLEGSSNRSASYSGSLSQVHPAEAAPSGFAQQRLLAASGHCYRSWPGSFVLSVLLACCAILCVLPFASAALLAQAPSVESPQLPAGGASAAPSSVSSPSSDVDFDIDLGTEEFENFGQEDFQVEEANYFRDTVVPMSIKIAIGVAIILLLAWVAMKVAKPKRPTSVE